MASCQQEDLPTVGEGIGYLSLEDIQIQAAEVETVQTRAVDDDLYVKINDVEYGPGKTEPKIELEAGQYTLEAYNDAYKNNASWGNENKGEAIYYISEPVQIEAGKTTYQNIDVPMINFAVRLALDEEVKVLFSDEALTVTSGERTITLNEGETAYFLPDATEFTYSLAAKNTEGDDMALEEKTKNDAKDGKLYVITYSLATKSLEVEE